MLSETGLGELRLDLYRERPSSTIQEEREASVTQTDNQSLGVVWYSLSFRSYNEILHVTVYRAENLPTNTRNNEPLNYFLR